MSIKLHWTFSDGAQIEIFVPVGAQIFHPSTASLKQYSGVQVHVLSLLLDTKTIDLGEVGPLFLVRTPDGTELVVLPEELEAVNASQ